MRGFRLREGPHRALCQWHCMIHRRECVDKVEGFRAQHVFFPIGKLIVSADRRAGYSSNDDPLFRVPSTYLHPTSRIHNLPRPALRIKDMLVGLFTLLASNQFLHSLNINRIIQPPSDSHSSSFHQSIDQSDACSLSLSNS